MGVVSRIIEIPSIKQPITRKIATKAASRTGWDSSMETIQSANFTGSPVKPSAVERKAAPESLQK